MQSIGLYKARKCFERQISRCDTGNANGFRTVLQSTSVPRHLTYCVYWAGFRHFTEPLPTNVAGLSCFVLKPLSIAYLVILWYHRMLISAAISNNNNNYYYSNICPTRCNVTQFILSGNCSTCFGCYHHPSSGEQTTVSTASGTYHASIAAGSSNGVINTRCCRYSCLRSWWWVEVPPETWRAVSR